MKTMHLPLFIIMLHLKQSKSVDLFRFTKLSPKGYSISSHNIAKN